MITEYFVVCEPGPLTLYKAVEKLIEQGWQPQGGIAVWLEGGKPRFAQAMVIHVAPGQTA